MNDYIDKNAILIRLEIERAAFNSVVAQVNPRLIDRIMVQDSWTVKDILAHISAWEIELLRWLEMAERGEPPDIPAPGTWSEYMEESNETGSDSKAKPFGCNENSSLQIRVFH